MPAHPNIILCICDQLRAFELGCYGNPVVHTPNIDALAAQGVRFDTAVSNYPVCMAARSVLLSGQYNRTCTGGVSNVAYQLSTAGDFNMPEYPQVGRPHLKDTTLPEILHQAGYYTSVIGKWHIHSWPDEVGFDEYLIPRVHHCHSGQSFTRNGGEEFVPDGYSVDFEAGEVEQYLANHSRTEQPFFLYYSISPPHCPVADAPENYRTMYRPQDISLRLNVDPDKLLDKQDYWFKVYRYDFRYYNLHLPYTDHLPEGYSLRHLIAEYYGMTTWMDAALGRVLRALDATGLANDTIILFTSDHGDNLGSHGLVQKGGPTEESVRIPLIVRWTGMREPLVVHGQVASLVDVAPTLLTLSGLATPPHMPGHDLAALVTGEVAALDDTHAIIETGTGAAIRTPDTMCYFPYANGHTLALQPTTVFDMAKDPLQIDNLALADTLSTTVKNARQVLNSWDRLTPWM